MSHASLELTRAALAAHGLEIFRVDGEAIQLAIRVRSHLMDAGVSVHLVPAPTVRFTVRAQSSDFPGTPAPEMFGKVRYAITDRASAQGFQELGTARREIVDPGDDSRMLDVWFELTFGKPTQDDQSMFDDVAWALAVAKCV